MNERYTSAKAVDVELFVFAIPRTEWERNTARETGDTSPFKYVVKSYNNAYEDAATLVMTTNVTVTVPEGIDLFERTLDTLREERKKAQEEADAKIADIDQQIKQLLLLTDQRSDEAVVASL